jgi:hypothetical protein
LTTRAQATAAPAPITLGDKTFRMSPLSDVDIGELDQWLQARIVRIARNSLPEDADPALRAETIGAALDKAATMTWMSPKGAEMMATLDGMAQLIWQGCHRNHPGLTPEDVRAVLLNPTDIELARATFERLNIQEDSSEDKARKKKRRKQRERDRKRNRRKSTPG